jgi:hypothetical protein
MAISYVEIEDRYFVQPSDKDNISVNVIIGNGQTGGYLIFLDKKFIAANKSANLKVANKLAGKKCLVSVTIKDLLDETNWTSVTVEVVNGDKSKIYGPYSKEAAAHLDTICYSFSLHFTNP